MNIEIDFTTHVPIYIQIMDQVKHMIATGELKPGHQLPTVRQMAADLRVNFNTVARAYRLLDEAGIISTQHGRGTFILEPNSEEESQRLRKQDMVRLVTDMLTQAQKLGFSLTEIKEIVEDKFNNWSEDGDTAPENSN